MLGCSDGLMRVVDVYRLSRRLKELADNAVPDQGDRKLNSGQLEVLTFLAENPYETVSGIARATLLSKSLVSRYVRELDALGMVEFEADLFDGRLKKLRLSEAACIEVRRQAEISVQWALYGHEPWLSYKQQRDVLDLLRDLANLLR